MSSEEENKALARHFLERTWQEGDLDAIDEMLAPDFVDHSLLPGAIAPIKTSRASFRERLMSSSKQYRDAATARRGLAASSLVLSINAPECDIIWVYML